MGCCWYIYCPTVPWNSVTNCSWAPEQRKWPGLGPWCLGLQSHESPPSWGPDWEPGVDSTLQTCRLLSLPWMDKLTLFSSCHCQRHFSSSFLNSGHLLYSLLWVDVFTNKGAAFSHEAPAFYSATKHLWDKGTKTELPISNAGRKTKERTNTS